MAGQWCRASALQAFYVESPILTADETGIGVPGGSHGQLVFFASDGDAVILLDDDSEMH